MTMSPKSRYLRVMGREIHFMEWGDEQAPVIVAWHGLARTGRDMDELAAYFAPRHRVICPDTIGRGLSQWSPDPDREYCLEFYTSLATELLDQLRVRQMDWIGTSMGGAIGTKAAASLLRGRIRRLVLNDNGPQLAEPAIERIRSYAGAPPVFATVSELQEFLRTVYKPYGWLSDREWTKMTETSLRRLPDGRVTVHYDPAITRQFTAHENDYALWREWDSLRIPVLCLRGAESDLLLPEVTRAMRERGPKAKVVEIQGCGHAPALNTPAQLGLIARFLGDQDDDED